MTCGCADQHCPGLRTHPFVLVDMAAVKIWSWASLWPSFKLRSVCFILPFYLLFSPSCFLPPVRSATWYYSFYSVTNILRLVSSLKQITIEDFKHLYLQMWLWFTIVGNRFAIANCHLFRSSVLDSKIKIEETKIYERFLFFSLSGFGRRKA